MANDETIKKKFKDNNIEYTPLPVGDFKPPTFEQLAEGNAVYRRHRGGTLVWCGYRHGRTGTMITALQIYAEKGKGEDKEDVDYRMNRVESAAQFELLDKLKEQS